MSKCQNCEILENEIAKLQARIDAAGNYCRAGVDIANKMIDAGNLGTRTYGRMAATVGHLSRVAALLGVEVSSPPATPFKKFRRFER